MFIQINLGGSSKMKVRIIIYRLVFVIICLGFVCVGALIEVKIDWVVVGLTFGFMFGVAIGLFCWQESDNLKRSVVIAAFICLSTWLGTILAWLMF